MSFSSEIKEEISKFNSLADKVNVKAEFIGYLLTVNVEQKKQITKFTTESEYNINRFAKLLNNLNITDYSIEFKGKNYVIELKTEAIERINNEIEEEILEFSKSEKNIKSLIRGIFLGSGYLNNPEYKYHLEIILKNEKQAQYLTEVIYKFGINMKLLKREKGYSIYTKDGEEISKLLALIGANKAVMKFEEVRVLRETSNSINRIVNCETANLNKTINASVIQIQDIEFLKKQDKFKNLSENLKEIAEVRLENPEASLVELGVLLKNPIGKSGVNHRLKKISQIADELRGGK